MSWVNNHEYLPEVTEKHDHITRNDRPFVYVAEHKIWSILRNTITIKQPDYPIQLIPPFSTIHGWRIRGYSTDYLSTKHRMSPRWEAWLADLENRVEPS